MPKHSTVAVLLTLAVIVSAASAFDWSSTAESAHQHNWQLPNMGSRIQH